MPSTNRTLKSRTSELDRARELEATRVLDKIEHAVEEFRSSELPQDDLTMVVARAQ